MLTPSLTALALSLIDRNVHDQRGWALVIAALAIGFRGALTVGRALKPFFTFIFLGWPIWLTI